MERIEGRVILVSKRILKNGEESYDTYFGKVIHSDENEMIVEKQNGETEDIPPFDEEWYRPAEEGVYELDDGSVYENPDYIGEFLVHESKEAWEEYHRKTDS